MGLMLSQMQCLFYNDLDLCHLTLSFGQVWKSILSPADPSGWQQFLDSTA